MGGHTLRLEAPWKLPVVHSFSPRSTGLSLFLRTYIRLVVAHHSAPCNALRACLYACVLGGKIGRWFTGLGVHGGSS